MKKFNSLYKLFTKYLIYIDQVYMCDSKLTIS